jgi:hypothetical protein
VSHRICANVIPDLHHDTATTPSTATRFSGQIKMVNPGGSRPEAASCSYPEHLTRDASPRSNRESNVAMPQVRSLLPLPPPAAPALAGCPGRRCAQPIGTAAPVEPDQSTIASLNQAPLPSPLPVVQLLPAQSNSVVEPGAAIEAEQRRCGKQVRLDAADYMIKPNILFSNPNAGGHGGLAGIGGMFGPVGLLAGMVAGSMRIQEAQTTLALIDVSSGVQRAVAEGPAKVQDFGGAAGLGGIGGYGNTAEGKLIVAALIDAHNKLVDIVGTDRPRTAHRGVVVDTGGQ